MPRQCQFPVQFSDNRRCYRSGTTPGFVIAVAAIAALSGYAGFSHAASLMPLKSYSTSYSTTSNLSGHPEGGAEIRVAPELSLFT